MKLLTKFLNWFCPERKAPRRGSRDEGRRFARQYLNSEGKKGRAQLGNWIDASRLFNDWTDFDQGIQDVLQETVKNDRA